MRLKNRLSFLLKLKRFFDTNVDTQVELQRGRHDGRVAAGRRLLRLRERTVSSLEGEEEEGTGWLRSG